MLVFVYCGQISTAYGNEITEDQSNLADNWTSNLRWSADLSTRHKNSLRGENSDWQHVIGFDLHKVFQSEKGDFGTLIIQPYLVRLTNVKNPPFFFDDGDDWELTWRITNFNYTGLAQSRLNFRVGHFEVPFGLEQNIDTNGTLRQYTFSNRGIKVDWGASVNGILDKLEYEIALTRGSGMEYSSDHDPYLFSGRVGTLSNQNFIIGFSGIHGEVLNATGTSNNKMLGIDIAHYIYQWELLLEASGGTLDDAERINLFTEVSWRSPLETLHLYGQFRQTFNKPEASWEDNTKITFGINYDFNTIVSLSGEIAHDIEMMPSSTRQSELTLQLRIRI